MNKSQKMSALDRAVVLQTHAAELGFDWPEVEPVFDKVREELAELAELTEDSATTQARAEELGDLLFACVNLARHLGVDPDAAMDCANVKFERRFRRVQNLVAEQRQSMKALPLETLDRYWEQAKREGL